VELANRLKPDLILLTGDYVTWDPNSQGAAVEALSGLHAPYGILGTLGNHELWTKTEDSISRLFAAQGVRILRGENTALRVSGDELNLIGVDYQTRRHIGFHRAGMVSRYLDGVERMVRRDTANILLSHNPNTFDRAAELGIDLSLAGHTHGGQVALEFISPEVAPSRLVTPYVEGWFSKPGGKLYVNRGLGTIGVPIRLGVPPEITLFELARNY
jgi:predicted MPP superfamily phosphohydrolase